MKPTLHSRRPIKKYQRHRNYRKAQTHLNLTVFVSLSIHVGAASRMQHTREILPYWHFAHFPLSPAYLMDKYSFIAYALGDRGICHDIAKIAAKVIAPSDRLLYTAVVDT